MPPCTLSKFTIHFSFFSGRFSGSMWQGYENFVGLILNNVWTQISNLNDVHQRVKVKIHMGLGQNEATRKKKRKSNEKQNTGFRPCVHLPGQPLGFRALFLAP